MISDFLISKAISAIAKNAVKEIVDWVKLGCPGDDGYTAQDAEVSDCAFH